MKQVLLVTYVDFWHNYAGSTSRISALIQYLKTISKLTIVFIGVVNEKDLVIIRQEYNNLNFVCLAQSVHLTIPEYIEKFAEFIKGKHFDFAILEYIEMFQLLPLLSPGTITILDTNDIHSEKLKTFEENDIDYEGLLISYEEEILIYSKFDYIILINNNDFNKVKKDITADKLLLVPHPVDYSKVKIREKVSSISFIASAYAPNVVALKWFLYNIWPFVEAEDVYLNIYGKVADSFRSDFQSYKNVNLVGFTKDLDMVYGSTDIVINPVKAGAGLKIKNVEALGHGLPLITTSHGIAGINEAALSGCLIVADSAENFIKALNDLIQNFSLRNEISIKAYDYAKTYFSHDICFKAVTELIK